jgi:hypothetical protein
VSADRRQVRVADSFFDMLDSQLGPDRGADGEPSATDFLVMEFPAVVERFATAFESLPEIVDGFGGGRMLIAPGMLVRAFVVYGLLITDGTIELIGLDIDH